MAQIMDHIERLREKPEHVRNRIALGVSIGATALVALVWATALATTQVFALKNEGPVAPEEVPAPTFAETKSAFSELVGAVGSAVGATSSDPTLQIVDTKTTTTFDTKVENDTDKTVVPF